MSSIQNIFRIYSKDYLEKYRLNKEQYEVFNSILNCKTSYLGGHMTTCENCKNFIYTYNSCKNRHCPNCQNYRKERWKEQRINDALDVDYFHIVFTIPGDLHFIFYQNKRIMYDTLLRVASQTIIELAREKYQYTPGLMMMLHTWNQTMDYHPHVHLVVTGGGLTFNGKWRKCPNDYFLNIDDLEKAFKKKLMNKILLLKKKELLTFYNNYEYLEDFNEFVDFTKHIYEKKWNCYCKEPFRDVEGVYEYLSKYVYKICMTDERIKKIGKKRVTFWYFDTRDRKVEREMTIDGVEYIRRYLLHVLPKSFMKIRYAGLYSGKNKKKRLKKLKVLTNTNKEEVYMEKLELLNKINGINVSKCRFCNSKDLKTSKVRKSTSTRNNELICS